MVVKVEGEAAEVAATDGVDLVIAVGGAEGVVEAVNKASITDFPPLAGKLTSVPGGGGRGRPRCNPSSWCLPS